MAVLAGHVTMRIPQLESGGEMIEAGALNGMTRGRRESRREDQQSDQDSWNSAVHDHA
jgi:hypothetical protein